ncbi:Septin-2-like 2 [Homarus americanus]|uniref:Septin-2-like 2 n=1 Tax=Homarus americanus TaxID=6706 RepID=A0A8J5JEU7_HOMAM|nr:Septin-2-like 2 [Homarus americanus]
MTSSPYISPLPSPRSPNSPVSPGRCVKVKKNPFSNPDMPGYVGFANLPNQIHRKSVKRGFEFTLMVVGESGLGKSTLINTLFLTDLYPDRVLASAQENIEKTVKIDVSTVEIEERGVKVRLTVVDTPGYGDAIDNTDCFQSIIQYINDQFERYLQDESGLNRRHIVDNRVHCCFYFINPAGHGLKPLDIQFMKQLHNKVNIVPVLAKADTLTKQEVSKLKRKDLVLNDEVLLAVFTQKSSTNDTTLVQGLVHAAVSLIRMRKEGYGQEQCPAGHQTLPMSWLICYQPLSLSTCMEGHEPPAHPVPSLVAAPGKALGSASVGRTSSFPTDCDTDEEEDYKEQVRQLKEAVPFAVVGSTTVLDVGGKKVRGRQYPWGVIEVENPSHCDFIKLRCLLGTHMQDLTEVTQDVHYENYRSERLAKGGGSPLAAPNANNNSHSSTNSLGPKKQFNSTSIAAPEKDRMAIELEEKEAQIRKMQEMMARMQAQLQDKK